MFSLSQETGLELSRPVSVFLVFPFLVVYFPTKCVGYIIYFYLHNENIFVTLLFLKPSTLFQYNDPAVSAALFCVLGRMNHMETRERMNVLNQLRRLTAGLLSVALLGTLSPAWLPAASAAQADSTSQVRQDTGSIAVTVRFDLPQRVDEVNSRGLSLQITGSGVNAAVSLADGKVSGSGLTAQQVQLEQQNTQGVPLTTEQQLGFSQAVLSQLPLGTYTLTLTGKGYAPCSAQVTLKDYSQHVILSTADGSFSLGDVDGSGKVDGKDLSAMDGQLDKTGALDVYDLNGDGLVDITDLAYVNRTAGLTAQPQLLSTSAIVSASVDSGNLTVQGDLNDLFSGGSTVTLASAEGQELAIPITLEQPVEMSEIAITTPSAAGAIQAGTALVETEDGQVLEFPFSVAAPEGTHATGRTAGQTVVTIDLGNKVPVKKVTIKVTKVEGQTGETPTFATVTQIEFLKDIVSDALQPESQVKGLSAAAGDKEVALTWNSVANVTGYEVRYGTGAQSLNQSLTVSKNQATVSGLENGTTYYFQVTAVNGDWKGTPSEVISAVPQPASAPGAPSNLVVEGADSALRLSWSKTKDASYYQVFYRVKGESTYLPSGGNITATSAVITGLTNGTQYEVAVKAGNLHGTGPYSAAATGTPKKESLEMPTLPETNRIDSGEVTSIVMANSGNVNWSLCPKFTVNDLIDGDSNTYWIANNYWYDSNITYTFQSTHDMNYLLLVPYLDSAYKNRIANYTVTLKGEDGQVLATYYRDGANITSGNYYIVSFPETKGVKSVTLSSYQYPMTTRQNIRYMRMFAGAFMYAAGEHIGVEYGSTAPLVQGKPTSVTGASQPNGLFGWGIAHEIGHNMDKLGQAETTNNIYSLALQAWDGSAMTLNTRLTEDGRWETIFNKVAQARPGTANNVFVQLGMYWQLHLAYDNGEQPLAFYNTFFKLWKSGLYRNSGYSYDEQVALTAAKAANRNLTEFFTRWGMTLSDGVKDILETYPAEERAIWYLDDAARTYRLGSGKAASGSLSVTASASEQVVTLTMNHSDASAIQGYEIRRNGVTIGFTTQSTYRDDLGAANNLTYTYTVVPVDKLGNVGAEVQSNEVLVSYDKTIDPSLYTLSAQEGKVSVTMKNGAVDVTGIKVTNSAEMSGSYTVTAVVRTEGKDDKTLTIKTGTLSGTELVAYFTKPGAAPEDTRIWTYSVVSLEITGLPEGAQVQLLDYPGDRVDFYQGAAVGILKDAYQGIPAGTLVILGTYRGNPVYNYVEIQARYNTTPEAGEVTTIERPMNGELYLLAEIPADGAVSDTSDGFFIFVPDMEAEAALNAQSGVNDPYPTEIRAMFYRQDDPNSTDSKRLTSQTLWLDFPDGGEDGSSLPLISFTGSNNG